MSIFYFIQKQVKNQNILQQLEVKKIYLIEQEGEYSFEYVKRNLDYFEYISNLIPSEVADMLNNYEYFELVMPL